MDEQELRLIGPGTSASRLSMSARSDTMAVCVAGSRSGMPCVAAVRSGCHQEAASSLGTARAGTGRLNLPF